MVIGEWDTFKVPVFEVIGRLFKFSSQVTHGHISKGPVKLIQWLKIAHSFLKYGVCKKCFLMKRKNETRLSILEIQFFPKREFSHLILHHNLLI